MTYDVSSEDSQEKATATGTHHGKHFKLVASRDSLSKLYVVHVYVSEELLNPYSEKMPADQSFKEVEVLKDQASIEAALQAGDEAAMACIEGR